MIDFSNLSLGTKLGCRYTFTAGTLGTFSYLGTTPNDGRKVKDPLIVDGSYFEAINAPDPKMVKVTSKVTLATYRVFSTTDTILASGVKTESEQVDFSLYKSVLDFSTAGAVAMTAIPKDQLVKFKTDINISDFVSGINSITIGLTNIFCKFAITLDGGTTYKTYDSTNKVWNTVDLTQSTDALKTAMGDYTVLNALTATDYASLSLQGKIGIAMLIGIDGTDTTKKYSLDSVTIDYIGTNDSTPSIQYFNFVFVGYDGAGNPKFIADKPIQTAISFSTLFSGKVVNGTDKVTITNAETGYDCYMRLPNSGIGSAYPAEYDALINSDIIPRNGKTIPEFWDTNIASMTRTISALPDTDGNPAAATSIVSRGGDSPDRYINFSSTATSVDHGFRPVLIVNVNAITPVKARAAFTPVTSTADLGPGKCISCEYSSTDGKLGTFSNLGKASKGLLADYNNGTTPNGTFMFNFVGYTTDGNIKLLADRVIQSGISFSDLATGNVPSILSGKEIMIDNNKQMLRFPLALSDKEPVTKGGEYDSIVNNSGNTSKTIEQIWHTAKSACFTGTISASKSNYIIAKGLGDENTTILNQRHYLSTDKAANLGFRPMLILEPNIRLEGLQITPYVGYEKQDYAKAFVVNATVILADGTAGQYALIRKSDKAVLSDYATTATRNLDVTLFDSAKVTTVSIVEKTTGVSLYDFDVYRDTLYRNSTTRTFGRIYGGYGNTNIQIDADVNGKATPIASQVDKPVLSGTATYASIPVTANKITFD